VGLWDAPLDQAVALRKLQTPEAAIEWITCPFGIEGVVSMLKGGLLDLALMFSEDVAQQLMMGSSLKICGTYEESFRRWGIYTSKSSGKQAVTDLANSVITAPNGLGAQLMCAMVAQQCGVQLGAGLHTYEVDNLAAAVRLVKAGAASAVVWETYSAKDLVRSGQWKMIREIQTPWPSLLFVATKDALLAKSSTIQNFLSITRSICSEFKLNKENQSVNYISAAAGFGRDDAEAWLEQCSWPCSCSVDLSSIVKPLEYLQLFESACRIPRDPSRFLADGVNAIDCCVSQSISKDSRRSRSSSPKANNRNAASSQGPADERNSHIVLEERDTLDEAVGSALCSMTVPAHPARAG